MKMSWENLVIVHCRSSFQEPEVKEGFEEIVPVYFVPEFPEEARATLYEKYLLDK